MIWHTEELHCKGQPEGTKLTFSGVYNPPGSNKALITIKLDIEQSPDDTPTTKILMEKNPSFLTYEEPTEDDIQRKYYRQVLVLRDKIMQTPFKDLLVW